MSIASETDRAQKAPQDKPPADYPKVSIIVPCYNGAKTLRAALDSALVQTYPNIEIVVVNDGSKDNSAEVAREYGDKIVYIEQENRGLSGARNTAVVHATGEFLLLLDADDVLLPESVEKRVKPMLDDPNVALVAGYYREIDAEGNTIERIPELRKFTKERSYYQIVRRNFGPPVGWAIRKSVLIKSGVFDPMMPHCEDWDLAIRITRNYEMAYVPEVTALYRNLPTSQSKRYIEVYDGVCQVLKKNAAYTQEPFKFWWLGNYAKFECGRRILYAVLTQGSVSQRLSKLIQYCVARPAFLWIGFFSVVSFLGGKRASAR